MEFASEAHHPNGFKVALALRVTGTAVQQQTGAGVYDGAVLRVAESVTGALMSLPPHAALLYLFADTTADTEAWLCWETSVLQGLVLGQLQGSSKGGRQERAEAGQLDAALATLDTHLSSTHTTYLAGQSMGASDVAVLGSLLLLGADASSSPLLHRFSNIKQYLATATDTAAVKNTVSSYYGCAGCSSIPITKCLASLAASAAAQATAAAAKPSTSLHKTKPAASTATPEPVKEERRVSESEVLAAEQGWQTGSVSRVKQPASPVLPIPGERNILITSALPYVNNVPHLGNIIGCILSADCFARFCRLREDNIVYICGTDEYGTATETKAIAEGLTPQQICDKYHTVHASIYKDFNISFDYFGRTTTQSQTDIVHELFWDLEKTGNISRECVQQLYCDHCSRFLADRFVEGVCPHVGCGYEDARGDQCDGCGKLVNAADLGKPRCKLCSATPMIKSSNHLFIDLPKIEPEMKKWFDVSSKRWTANATTICNSWIRDGLLPRCITRDLKWGVTVPLEGYTDKVFYVWFDATIGYISITKEYTKEWEKWWKNPDEVQLYQFMAKDNVPFHGIIFPCTLTGSPTNWTRVSNVMATEYLNYEDGKFSKSRGVGVFGDQAMETGIPSDVWRFYLLYIRPESQDTAFSWSDLQMKNNSELLNNLGNFVNRALKFVAQFYDGVVPSATPNKADYNIMAAINNEILNYTNAVGNCRLREGLRCILSITRIGNQYIQENEPYKLIKADRSEEEKIRGGSVIAISANIVYLVALLLEPFMPDTTSKILGFLNKPPASKTRLPSVLTQVVKPGDRVTAPEPLIKKITDEEIKEWQLRFKGKSDPAVVEQKITAATPGAPADPAQIKKFEKLVSEQGEKVRSMKAGGASKGDVALQVKELLALKQQLSQAQGVPEKPATDSKGKKKKGDASVASSKVTPAAVNGSSTAAPATNGSSAAVDEAEVGRCQALVDEQASKVRSLKSGGASKEEVTTEVAALLRLKAALATAQGVDPATLTTKSKGKKK